MKLASFTKGDATTEQRLWRQTLGFQPPPSIYERWRCAYLVTLSFRVGEAVIGAGRVHSRYVTTQLLPQDLKHRRVSERHLVWQLEVARPTVRPGWSSWQEIRGGSPCAKRWMGAFPLGPSRPSPASGGG